MCMYSKGPLIWLGQDLRCAELSNRSYTWAVQLVRGIFIWVSFPSAGSGSSGSFCLFFEVFIAVDVGGVGGKLSGDIAMLNIWTLSEAFFNVSWRSVCFIDEAFFWWGAKLPVLGLLFSSAGLLGFPAYRASVWRNFAVISYPFYVLVFIIETLLSVKN